jgi:lipid II isoglutaminyl synthase (glutamine-hydrolysing)
MPTHFKPIMGTGRSIDSPEWGSRMRSIGRSDNLASVSPKKPLRSKLASSVSRSAAALSRATGRGDGAVIGGKIGLMIDPNLLANLAAGRQIALISGTNGKTTTTRLTAAALGVLGDVATNSFGANMPTGHTSALARAGDTPFAVLEVDEHYLPQVISATNPHVVALLNLSRDQLDRAKEVAMMAELWRDTLTKHPVHVVANADDPMITWAANAAIAAGASVTWVAAGQRWHDDSWVCPNCGAHIERGETPSIAEAAASVVSPPPSTALDDATMLMRALPSDVIPPEVAIDVAEARAADADITVMVPISEIKAAGANPDGDQDRPFGAAAAVVAGAERAADLTAPLDEDEWHCTKCTLRRPATTWQVDGDTIIDPIGRRHLVTLQLPGRVNRANAATALAVAAQFGVDPAAAVGRLASVASIAGRYAQVDRDGRNIRLLLAKNPAGWLEAFDMAEHAPTLLSINSRDPDGLDTSWLFDVDFSPLHGRKVLISGDRAFDLAVRLEVNDIAFAHVRTFGEAIASVPAGRLEVIANYTAFQDIRAELDRVN